MKLEFYLEISEEVSNIKFHRNPASGNRRVLCGETDRPTEMTKLIDAFRNFANEPKIILWLYYSV